MAPPAAPEDFIAHGLRAELYGFHTVTAQSRQFFLRYGIRPCRYAKRRYGAGLPRRNRRGKELLLLGFGHGSKAAAVKRQLISAARRYRRYGGAHRFRRSRKQAAGDALLVAENAVIRAACMRDKYGENASARRHSRSASSALAAAVCSASFLVRPVPRPIGSPFRQTCTRNVFA